jgi:hypothetical protein
MLGPKMIALALVDNDTTVIALRLASLYAPEADYTCFVARYLDRRFSPFVGRPDAYISMLHADDSNESLRKVSDDLAMPRVAVWPHRDIRNR